MQYFYIIRKNNFVYPDKQLLKTHNIFFFFLKKQPEQMCSVYKWDVLFSTVKATSENKQVKQRNKWKQLWKQTSQKHKDKKSRFVGFVFYNVNSTFLLEKDLQLNFLSLSVSFPEMFPTEPSSHSYSYTSSSNQR